MSFLLHGLSRLARFTRGGEEGTYDGVNGGEGGELSPSLTSVGGSGGGGEVGSGNWVAVGMRKVDVATLRTTLDGFEEGTKSLRDLLGDLACLDVDIPKFLCARMYQLLSRHNNLMVWKFSVWEKSTDGGREGGKWKRR